jgi:hypothetical protein
MSIIFIFPLKRLLAAPFVKFISELKTASNASKNPDFFRTPKSVPPLKKKLITTTQTENS